MNRIRNVIVYGEPVYEDALKQIENCAKSGVAAALMADHHVGYSMPIGGVVAYKDKISPSGVGYDIACGNKAVLTDMPAKEARRKIRKLMDDIFEQISFGVGLNNNERVDHELFDDPAWKVPICMRSMQLAQNQLGTVGSGNHYVDLFVDQEDRVWVAVHFGSRGLGHRIATEFIKLGGGKDGMFVDPVLLDVRSSIGSDYLEAMRLAGLYAYAGRDWVCQKVLKIMGAREVMHVHCHHNYAWKESHRGEEVWVVRKGATPAFPGQRNFVGGSMGDVSVILEGLDTPENRDALYSTVHGAGRVLSRTQAAGKRVKGKRVGGQVTPEMMRQWVKREQVELRGAGTDEAPQCYKRLPEVLKHHEKTIRVTHTLRPIGVAMAGEGVEDPYKD